MKKNKNISVIITLYKTPLNKLKNLNVYKNYKTLIFDQEGDIKTKKFLEKKFGKNLRYFFSMKNVGLSKASNFLLSQVKTKFFLFTQPDVKIENNSIIKLCEILEKKKNLILISPKHKNKGYDTKSKKQYSYTKEINFACLLFDTKKIKKIGFFDDDFFLYWEDIYLKYKINNTNYKMAIANNVFIKHFGSQSSKKSYKIDYIRDMNYIFGELVYDTKLNNLRLVKILRKLFQSVVLIFFYLFTFRLNIVLKKIAIINGVAKFLKYFLLRK